ncbi:MAG: hypothetical protein HOK52_05495 [Candidatus Marinimicrobia bacterium]|jgi:hypothetical protein|nr:hypothetical protein [Candidatus Neomarinimicrobiota bacterium]MBT3960511.1 hypothetical protein [Candidatus Neomarinimicrobiota bacterium]MBT4384088.1 hypothetical protein [Candidatus Neomarinimicrobiota bacterium]MBT5068430.1 hypothetical protein [Candidatus Neomarinimicrobiota bacterium]MBT6470696.1 hypothetical protein [Candidatus Neomarinimicrobiota bacterium]
MKNSLMYVQGNPNIQGIVMEYMEQAKTYLLSNGCTILKRHEKGKDCYMDGAYGIVFNLWENKK